MKILHLFFPFLFVASASLYAATSINLESDPSDWIGQGERYSYSDDNAIIEYARNFGKGITVKIRNLPNEPFNGWTLNLAAPDNKEIQPGVYEKAERFPLQSSGVPGISFSGNGRGCYTLSGRFEVFNVSYDSSGNVVSLKAAFEQHCEGGAPALHGSIVYTATIPLGASVSGLEVNKVVCNNRTSGQRVMFETTGSEIDCKQEGLQVNPGDEIDFMVLGTAE